MSVVLLHSKWRGLNMNFTALPAFMSTVHSCFMCADKDGTKFT